MFSTMSTCGGGASFYSRSSLLSRNYPKRTVIEYIDIYWYGYGYRYRDIKRCQSLKDSSNISFLEQGRTALHEAARWNHTEVIEYLVKEGIILSLICPIEKWQKKASEFSLSNIFRCGRWAVRHGGSHTSPCGREVRFHQSDGVSSL